MFPVAGGRTVLLQMLRVATVDKHNVPLQASAKLQGLPRARPHGPMATEHGPGEGGRV